MTREEMKELADTGQYRRIPLTKEIYSDRYTPVGLMRKLRKQSHHCFLLESASQKEHWGRYSFLGYDPVTELSGSDFSTHPGEKIRELLAAYKSPKLEGLPPFSGGLVGYFSYDYIKYNEPKLVFAKGEDDFKDLDLMLFDRVIAFDHYKQKVILIAGVMTENFEESYEAANAALEEMQQLITFGEEASFPKLELQSEVKPAFDEATYSKMIEKAKHYIHEGDIFQVVLSNPIRAKATGSLLDTYRVLRASNPSPYMFYFSSDDIELAGASPETLVKVEDRTVRTFPLAGTRPRGKTKEEDEALEKELLADEKELAEHNMLVDLGRNDMGRICKVGSVAVEQYLGIERYSQVMHIGSTVVGELAEGKDAVDAMNAILPAGTLSGAPKFRACEIIEELENSKRGVYGGALGYLDFTGNMDVCIAIRLVYKKNGEICIRSGAGIVADSNPIKEYEECKNKAKAVLLAIEQAKEGLE
ncbi:MAG: anthranilate synthase component I [Lachnospiraceae bacterium]|nr:anthranilate synthase component I [Lachnospiraceae bacterium]MBQ1720509.1 anthranilate synthase component I [Lachnospiraceae bacterium]MBQ5385677.1 anthranilate synthase component I [Lachnospiraceae bacterium]